MYFYDRSHMYVRVHVPLGETQKPLQVLKARIPQMPKDEEYTGFLAWNKKDCSQDFLNKLDDGTIG